MPLKLQDMLLKEYFSTKSSFHTNVLHTQIKLKIGFALLLLFPRGFPRDSTFLPFLAIPIPPNLDDYLSLRTSESHPSSFLHFQAQYAPAPSLPLHGCRLHVARGLSSHLILGFGLGYVSMKITYYTTGWINRVKESEYLRVCSRHI